MKECMLEKLKVTDSQRRHKHDSVGKQSMPTASTFDKLLSEKDVFGPLQGQASSLASNSRPDYQHGFYRFKFQPDTMNSRSRPLVESGYP